MHRRSFLTGLAGLAVAAVATSTVVANASTQWVLLGSQTASHHADRDVIYVGADEGRFMRLYFTVQRNSLHVGDVKVYYAGGQVEHLSVAELIPQGGNSRVLDLAGHARRIEKIEFLYQSHSPHRPPAMVQVYGLKTSFGPGPGPGVGNWEVLGSQRVSFFVDHDAIHVGAGRGLFRALKLRVRSHDIFMYNLRVRFAGGQVQEFPVNGLIRAGQTTGLLDLSGHRRVIERVDMVYRTRPGFHGTAHVDVLGLH